MKTNVFPPHSFDYDCVPRPSPSPSCPPSHLFHLLPTASLSPEENVERLPTTIIITIKITLELKRGHVRVTRQNILYYIHLIYNICKRQNHVEMYIVYHDVNGRETQYNI